MSFLSSALRRAENFLEQVDESVAQVSRRMVVEGVAGDYDDQAWVPSADDPMAAELLDGGMDQRLDTSAHPMDSSSTLLSRRSRGVSNIPKVSPAVPSSKPSRPSVMNDDSISSLSQTPLEPALVPKRTTNMLPQAAQEYDTSVIGDHSQKVSELLSVSTDTSERVGSAEISGQLTQAPSNPTHSAIPDTALDHNGERAASAATDSNVMVNPSQSLSEASNTRVLPASHTRVTSSPENESVNSALAASTVPFSTSQKGTSPDTVPRAKNVSPPSDQPELLSDSNTAMPREVEEHVDVEHVIAVEHENEELRKELDLLEEDFQSLIVEREKHVSNVQRLKNVVSDMEESLEQKTTDVRRLQKELSTAKDETSSVRRQLKEAQVKGRDALDGLRKDFDKKLAQAEEVVRKAQAQNEALNEENSRLKEAITKGREVDMATADGARQQASSAQAAYEQEVAAHLETKNILKKVQESLDAKDTLSADAIASAQRKAEDAIAAERQARATQRAAEAKLNHALSARDAALARIVDIEQSLARYENSGEGQPVSKEELFSLRQTVSELENALEAKNVELTRLEGEVENMRSAMRYRAEAGSGQRVVSPLPGSTEQIGNSAEVEQKLRHMADSALRKQAQVEALRSENKALQHQLDTERKRTREAQAMAVAATSSRHTLRGGIRGLMDTGDEERGERPYGIREGPMTRFRAPRAWPKAFTGFLLSIDKLSAEVIAFLRKEPLLRMVILVYVCALHIFVYCLLHYHVESASDIAEHVAHVAKVGSTSVNPIILGAKLRGGVAGGLR